MQKAKNIKITEGSILISMIRYTIPIILGSILQVAFHAADLMVVGKMGTNADTAAVGAIGPITTLFVNSAVGLSLGSKIMLSRALGKKDEKRTKDIVNTSILGSFFLGIIIMLAVLIFSKPLLIATECPEACFDKALLYLRIYSISIPCILLYNYAAALIRAAGDSDTPFNYLVIAGITNVIMNVVFCFILDNKVIAVAIATVISVLLKTVLASVYLIRSNGPVRFSFRELSFSGRELLPILKLGLPSAFNSSLYSISNLQMITEINSYGEFATSGNAAASSLEGLVSAFYGGLMASITIFVAQNLGAGKKERVKKSIITAQMLGLVSSLILGVGCYLLGEFLLGLYLPGNELGISFGMVRMKYLMIWQFVSSIFGIFVNAMQAFGYSVVPMINSMITVLLFRVVWLEWIYPPLIDNYGRNIKYLYACYTVSWLLSLVVHTVTFAIIYRKYVKGKLKSL